MRSEDKVTSAQGLIRAASEGAGCRTWTIGSLIDRCARYAAMAGPDRLEAIRRLVEIGLKAKLRYRAGGAEDEGEKG